ncbi:MAG: Sb-PDE family phosphodiesterase [Bacteroidota bacterium]
MKSILVIFCCLGISPLFSQHSHSHGRAISFPDVSDYRTLSCDFHQHTVFSDGSVWPNIRVQEAIKDGLDAISLTEHLEYQPYSSDIPHPDRNRSFQIAEKEAENQDLLIIHGSEITRSMPPGHANALFIQDANKLLEDDVRLVFEEAHRQGAFVFWNHPNWTAQAKDGIARLSEMHQQLIKDDLLHGIEVVNDLTYSDEALQLALDHDLTIMGTSDIHGLVDWQYKIPEGGHRPITLVFAKEKTAASIKEALIAGRTVAYFHDLLVGREAHLLPLLQASISVASASYQGESSVCTVEIENHSDAPMTLQNLSSYTLHAHADVIQIDPHHTTSIGVKTLTRLDSFSLSFEVLNAIKAPQSHPVLELKVSLR